MAIRADDLKVIRQPQRFLDMGLDDEDSQADPLAVGRNPLDSATARKKLSKLKEWWLETRQAHSENRLEQMIDVGFYDGEQWRDEDAREVMDRGQHPLVYNKTSQHINWLLGTERRTKIDYKVLPRGGEDSEAALTKQQLLKYVSDVNKGQFARSRAFADSVKSGVGWLESGIRSDPSDEPIYERYEHWRNMWWDHLAKESDLSDARYIFRSKWTDQDIAMGMFPNRKDAIRQSSRHDEFRNIDDDEEPTGYTPLFRDSNGNPFLGYGRSTMDESFHIGTRRRRNRLIECWYRQPQKVEKFRGVRFAGMGDVAQDLFNQLDGQAFNPEDRTMREMVNQGLASTYDAIDMKVHVAIWSGEFLLLDQPSPYEHDRFPFIPVWCYRRDRDGMPYGPIRNMRDAQEDLNKRKSKALFILSTNQLIGDEDAFEDWEEAADEAARPDGILKHRRGAQFEINRNIELAGQHVELMMADMQFLESTSGVTEENLGEINNVSSGTAINLRQVQGSVVTALLFDNLREAVQLQGEINLSLIEQFYAEPKKIRITNDRGRSEFMEINTLGFGDDGMPKLMNPITESQADFVVDTQDFRESMRMAMFDQLMEMTTRLDPEVTMQILDLVVELSDVPGKDEIVRRIRRINGQTDPEDPKRDEIEAGRDAQAAEDADRQVRKEEADIAAKEAQTGKFSADAKKSTSDANKSEADAALSSSEAMRQAVEIVAMLKGDTNLARAVDVLMDSFAEGGDVSDAVAVGPPAQTLETETPFTIQAEQEERERQQQMNSSASQE